MNTIFAMLLVFIGCLSLHVYITDVGKSKNVWNLLIAVICFIAALIRIF